MKFIFSGRILYINRRKDCKNRRKVYIMEDKHLRDEIENLRNRVKELEEKLHYSEEQRIAEYNISESLRENKEKFQNLIENTADLLWETDEKGVFIYVSPHCNTILGYNQEEITGNTPFHFMTCEEGIRVKSIFEKNISDIRPFKDMENTLIHRDGHAVVFETSAVPLFNSLNMPLFK